MKPAAFEYQRPSTLAEANMMLDAPDSRVIAGSQSLGPMLNLRLAQPKMLVDVRSLPELCGIEERADALVIGAAVTHGAIEDGKAGDIGQDVLKRIAAGIAYRAVRMRGTIGGSLAHADPAADWVTSLTALGATVMTGSAGAWRCIPMDQFILGAFATALKPGEIVRAVEIPKLGAAARWGYYKICRKPGEFALAIGAVLHDPARKFHRSVIGATGGKPVIVENPGDAAEAGALHVAALRRAEQVAS